MAMWVEPREELRLKTWDIHVVCDQARKLLGVRDDVWLDGLCPKLYHTTEVMNAKLEELRVTIEQHPTDELVAWIRSSYLWRDRMPAWEPLLAAATAQCTERNSPEFTRQIFIGLIDP